VSVDPPVFNHLRDTQGLAVLHVPRASLTTLETYARVEKELHVTPKLVVQEKVDLQDVLVDNFFIFQTHSELVVFVFLFICLFEIVFLEFFVDFVNPIFGQSVFDLLEVFKKNCVKLSN